MVPPQIIPYNFQHENEDGERYVSSAYYAYDNKKNETVNPYFYGKCKLVSGQMASSMTKWSECDQSLLFNDLKPDYNNNPYKARFYGFLFNTYVMLQIFNEINARKLLVNEINPFKGFFNNKFFLFVLIISVVVQIILVEIPPLASVLKIKPLNIYENLISICIGASCIIWGKELYKILTI
jgi:magnesium-transporting ATPase (P-type)